MIESKMDIPLDMVGVIRSGQDAGNFIKIIDDRVGSGGFFVLTASGPDMANAFDDWVENEESLQQYFRESKWMIEWLD